MKADVQYNDFVGTAAADISDFLGSKFGDNLDSFGKYFKIDETRFKVIGISISGRELFHVSFLCVDKKQSTRTKDYIVKMSIEIENNKEILNFLFKRLNIVLHSKFDNKYQFMSYDEEVRFSDFHKSENE